MRMVVFSYCTTPSASLYPYLTRMLRHSEHELSELELELPLEPKPGVTGGQEGEEDDAKEEDDDESSS